MKNKNLLFVGILCVIVGLMPAAGAESMPANSKISAVTVYPGSARITREAKVDLTPGSHSIIFSDIVPQFDENSLTVAGQGTAKVKILGGYLKQEYLKEAADQRVQELQTKIEEVSDKLSVENANEQVIADQKDFLKSLKLHAGEQLPKDLVTKMPTTIELGDMMKFIGSTREGLEAASEEIKRRKRQLNMDLQKLQNELAMLNSGGTQWKHSVIVDVECVQSGSLTVNVSYVLNGASWFALYDAHSALTKSEVELVSSASVRQTTGEDWKDVKLTLSTAQPAVGGRMPYVNPWVLSENVVYPMASRGRGMMKSLAAVADSAVAQEGAMQYEAFNAVATSTPAAPPEEKAMFDFAQAGSSGVSVTYALARPVSILSDGTENKFPISSQTLKADFEYSSYPRESQYSYLGTKVINATDLQLLAGPVNLFLDNEFVGKSSIDAISPGQDFDLYLGVDENVKVKRDLLEKKMDDTLIGGIQSPNRKIQFKYKLSAENFTSKAIKFKLFESMPTSANDRIKVKISDVSVQPAAKDWKDRKGVWLWELKLEPKAKQEIYYSFVVEYPRDMNVGGL